MEDIKLPKKPTPNKQDFSINKEPFKIDEDKESVNSNQEIRNDFNLSGSSLPPNPNKPKRSKKTVLTITFLVVLLLVSVGASAYLYNQQKDMQKQIDTLTSENNQLKENINTLKYDNKDSATKQKLLTEQNDLFLEKMKMLKTNCGTNCKDITLPL